MDKNHYILQGILKGIDAFAEVVEIKEPRLDKGIPRWAKVTLAPKPEQEKIMLDFLSSRAPIFKISIS